MGAERTVWVTRAEPGASATAARIESLGLRPLVAPLLTVQALDAPIDLIGVGALAFTSVNGVRAFAHGSAVRNLPVFAVGDATADAARGAGFAEVISANDNGAALVRLIIDARPQGEVLVPGPKIPSGDIPGALRRAGLRARAVALYETLVPEALPGDAAHALRNREVAAILIHSVRAGEALARFAAPFNWSQTAAIGLSPACLRPLANLALADRATANRPREDALLDALLAALGKPPRAR